MAAPTKTTRKPRQSEFGKRLAAKQFARNEYGLRERQFRKYFDLARKDRQGTGTKLLELLERRLDNIVYRFDLTQTRRQARQWVGHGHILVNGKKVNIPSYQVQIGDEITVKLPDLISQRGVDVPSWLKLNAKKTGGTIEALPIRDELGSEIDDQLIVEFYSR